MNEKQETVADIVASLRAQANELEKLIGDQHTFVEEKRKFIDRIEAAHKREVGNSAKLREAVEACLFYLEHIDRGMNDYMRGLFETAYKKAKAALAEPRRNCDVGTAEEQTERFYGFCESYDCGRDCPVFKGSCVFEWAQMPYEEGGEK